MLISIPKASIRRVEKEKASKVPATIILEQS